MPPPIFSRPSSSSVPTTSSQIAEEDAAHILRRYFLGPMPDNVLLQQDAHQIAKRKRFFHLSNDSRESDEASHMMKNYALRFFLNEGGREEEWGEQEERSTREEMLRRWQESEWGQIISLRRKGQKDSKRTTTRWVGNSFEVGNIVGVNIFLEAEALSRISSRTSAQSNPYLPLDLAADQVMSTNVTTGPTETFVTAPSELPGSAESVDVATSTIDQRLLSADEGEAGPSSSSPSSSTALLPPRPPPSPRLDSSPSEVRSEPSNPTRKPIIRLPSFAKSDVGIAKDKGKKVVHYDLSPISPSPLPTSPTPASPADVLVRTHSEVADTSAGAMSNSAFVDDYTDGEKVILRDRMFVRIYSNSNTLANFTEEIHRTTKELHYEDWAEFLVAWRKGRIELYHNHTVPGKEWITGHKHLSYTILLDNDNTHLSLYSFVDLSFCITALPTHRFYNPLKNRWDIKPSKEGTSIFIFKLKSRSRSYDWVWKLWRAKGNDLPPSVEVRNPRLESKVKINTPGVDTAEALKVFSRDNIIGLCIHSLSKVSDWKYVIEREVAEGKALQLAWRNGTFLDWIWLDEDVDGQPRRSNVLCGLAIKQSKIPLQLEIRLGDHYPSFVHLKSGEKLLEPPAIEGYLSRIKPSTRQKEQVYLCTHGAYLFSLRPSDANPPTPLEMQLDQGNTDDPQEYAEQLRKSEVQRGVTQIMKAMGVGELTSILAVRRAFQVAVKPTHIFKHDDEVHSDGSPPDREPEDDGDEGGHEALNKADDQNHMKMKRSFELLLKSGRVVRFETHSRRVASEWVERLRELITFWKARLRQDTQDEMNLAQTRRPRVTPLMHVDDDHIMYTKPLPDDNSPLPSLGNLYNWCVLDGCRSITRNGKAFMRKGLSGGYKLTHLFLVSEYLLQFRVGPKSSLQTHMRKSRIPLVDAYIFSGYFAAQCLPSRQFDVNAENLPRRYQDGLEVDDSEEDRLFVICYRTPAASELKRQVQEHQTGEPLAEENGTEIPNPKKSPSSALPKPPSLDAKRKLAIFRTRSRLERDAWMFALNSEIERIVRKRKQWEGRIRNEGELMDI